MQISKFSSTVCLAAFCAGVISVHAQDTPAQAAARAALMAMMNGQSAPTEQAPVVVKSSGVTPQQTSAPAKTNQMATPAPTTTQTPMTTPPASDAEAQAAARAALLQTMSQPPAATPAPAAMPAPAKPVVPEVKPAPATPAIASSASSPANTSGFAPMVAPPLPISADQQARLEALNTQYFGNQISPQEYFKQREAILKGQ